ncbi:uncharacterized protein BDZ99DRAFT_566529 [Mytilinidion resinicola]|uniref:Uncharacterized protein n=1 Tax=Mytilinidion resinicola TaxID=574789 RepID=A0A6A6Z317_9PEZI|nr:uncharacterized protein BDZ99DRAFT_566529 [Mytilinidion resinicola]KAF2814545.1 hypothetical protein BDZ99DRAFT_566529 [Mytilinidion resinicola]
MEPLMSIEGTHKLEAVTEFERPPSDQIDVDPDLFAPSHAATKTKYKLSVKNGKIACSPAVYPQAVTCTGLVQVYSTQTLTVTAKKTHTNTAPTPTSTTSTTITVTSTSTITPISASTTLSFTETDTLTFTESDTATVTVATVTSTVGAVAPHLDLLRRMRPQQRHLRRQRQRHRRRLLQLAELLLHNQRGVPV